MEWDKPVDKLTNQALAFETKASALKKHVLKHVYYTPEFEGAINTRARGEKEFEYAPLSRLFFEMTNGSFFEFRDSSTFLIYYGYYTLDVIAHDKTPSVEQACQDNFFQWSQFLGQEIEDVVIDWRSINYRHYPADPPDIYPRQLILKFGNKAELVIIASEIDLDAKGNYTFQCPDEAIVVFFSRGALNRYFPERKRK
jgi:hypothetical protein